MKEDKQEPLHHHQRKATAFSLKKLTKPTAYFILLLLSYTLGYLSASSPESSPHSPTPIISQNTFSTNNAATNTAGDRDHYRFETFCADPVPSKLVRQTILDRVFNGTSPYDNFPPAHVIPLLRQKRIKGWGSYGAVFKNLISKVQPKTIIEVGTFLGASAIHMAELASGLGLKTQIICVDDFRGWPGFRDRFKDIKMVNGDVMLLYQFMQNVVHSNATESVLFLPYSSGSTLQMLCSWGVFGDLIEVDAGHDFHSAWMDINRAYKILRPGGVIFGHDYFTAADNKGVRRAVNLFARVNSLRVQVDGEHWVINSA
ncbi:uncharacterized protein LOC132276829 [Cornus florida]|uniref:uncharacterized protein LOC132276829 n=1 Tax=Cornus florida TaxID=4283 RepID=UPI00289FA960|nr:uncharacterized protein LOC132276829 [Cornus florida]